MSTKVNHSVNRLQAAVNAAQAQLPEDSIAHTVLSGQDGGSFVSSQGVAEIGTFTHLVLQIMPDGTPMARSYKAGIGKYEWEPIIGGSPRNTTAHDLSGKKGHPFPEKNPSLAEGFLRCMQVIGDDSGSMILDHNQVLLSRFWAVFKADSLRAAVASIALDDMANSLVLDRLPLRSAVSAIDGKIVGFEPVQNKALGEPDFGYLKIFNEVTGENYDVIVPVAHEILCKDNMVKKDVPFVVCTREIEWNTCCEVAWFEAQAHSPIRGGMFSAIPIQFVEPLIRQGHKPERILEDVRHMCGVDTTNPAGQIRLMLRTTGRFYDLPQSERNKILLRMRAELGDNARYATTEDMVQAFDHPEQALRLSGMAKTQAWPVTDANSMKFSRPGVFADFVGLKTAWYAEFGSMDPRKFPLPVARECDILSMALERARQAKEAHGDVIEAAAAALTEHTDNFSDVVGTMRLVSKQEDAIEYLEQQHANRKTQIREMEAVAA